MTGTTPPYWDGYAVGLADGQEETGARAAVAAAVQEARELLGEGMDPAALSDYWLGYYHGRYHARTGKPAPGNVRRVARN